MQGSEQHVDARGLACPVPVVRVRAALNSIAHGRVVVLVDDPVARENLARLAAHLGCTETCHPIAGGFQITIDKPPRRGDQP